MNLGYWNINKLNNDRIQSYLIDYISKEELDLLFLSEYENLNFSELDKALYNIGYKKIEGFNCKKVMMIKKSNLDYIIVTDSNRYIISKSNNNKITISSLHLQSKPYSSAIDRADTMIELFKDLTSDKIEYEKMILVGDFNCLPTDNEIVKRGKICCIPFKEEVRKSDDKYMFYNPILLMLNEKENMYGSFRYTGTNDSIIWYPYDQVMVSKKLIDKIINVKYLKRIGNKDLVNKNGIPNVSDHLPLFFTIIEEE